MKISIMAVIAAAMLASPTLAQAQAQAQRGPVAAACASDIEQYCKGLPHVNRAVRICLEKNKDNVAAACRQALESTGGGRGCGPGGGCGRGRQAQ
ncbi:hypothetical protein CCR94_21945 [Rhodoblastus sphagnicola]|uniref:Cysteine rich repeat protein n=1 Tax=Rhodoblastus sphagnicola TaxID=333368 RepID=A0A2S6MWA0_9HYPH|nr:hypothetical protein [Rhodoblastus sphagnicola]MBB4196669.1 hypothetical protein [Rhodoblastus sphagnicola]PPQ26629.1 hypothetical protein CCR94_21945 [Rhodoblastus sphagnicola]